MTDDDLPDISKADTTIGVIRDAITTMALPPPAEDAKGWVNHDIARVTARRIQAIRLRVEHRWSYERIAAHLGYNDKSAAYRAIDNALKQVLTEDVGVLRAMDNATLDELHATWWPRARGYDTDGNPLPDGPDLDASKHILDIQARRARLNGLDAPVQVAISSGAAAELADALADLHQIVLGEAWEVTGDDDPGTGHPGALEG